MEIHHACIRAKSWNRGSAEMRLSVQDRVNLRDLQDQDSGKEGVSC